MKYKITHPELMEKSTHELAHAMGEVQFLKTKILEKELGEHSEKVVSSVLERVNGVIEFIFDNVKIVHDSEA
jgi:hypothetical protein